MSGLKQFFEYRHLLPRMQEVAKPFAHVAQHILSLPENPERTMALRKLLEARDCAVRAEQYKNLEE